MPHRTVFQSAPACERATAASKRRRIARVYLEKVSIRARVRAGDRARLARRVMFQSAPACERATARSDAKCSFNPRPRASGRRLAEPRLVRRYTQCFNPRPRASGRPAPRELRPLDVVSIRARVRAGDLLGMAARMITVSIRARVRAGDVRRSSSLVHPYLFQSAPACERATRAIDSSADWQVFQSAPACERATCTRVCASNQRTQGVFQSAPACERATRTACGGHYQRRSVSIRARVRAGDRVHSTINASQGSMFQSAPACERATARSATSLDG